MTLLGFKEQFVPNVLAGYLARRTRVEPGGPAPKLHSIRAVGKSGACRFKVGERVQLYRRVRQADMRKIIDEDPVITKIEAITIQRVAGVNFVAIDSVPLWGEQAAKLAVADGFPGEREFFEFFLPPTVERFEGHIIHWGWL